MQFFPLVAFQHWILGIFLGFILLVIVYLAFGSHGRRRESVAEKEDREILFGEEPGEKGLPPALIVVFLGAVLFALGYVVLIGIQGPPF
jgi:hypothetical protein